MISCDPFFLESGVDTGSGQDGSGAITRGSTIPIREVLIHKNYLSRQDIDICLRLNMESVSETENIEGIHNLHNTLIRVWGEEL